MLNSREEQKSKIHITHKMGEPEDEVLSPAGTPRIYSVTKCVNCEAQYAEHPAGFFIDNELFKSCLAVPSLETNEVPPIPTLRENLMKRMEELLAFETNTSGRWDPVKKMIYTSIHGQIESKRARKEYKLVQVSPMSEEIRAVVDKMPDNQFVQLFECVCRRYNTQM